MSEGGADHAPAAAQLDDPNNDGRQSAGGVPWLGVCWCKRGGVSSMQTSPRDCGWPTGPCAHRRSWLFLSRNMHDEVIDVVLTCCGHRLAPCARGGTLLVQRRWSLMVVTSRRPRPPAHVILPSNRSPSPRNVRISAAELRCLCDGGHIPSASLA